MRKAFSIFLSVFVFTYLLLPYALAGQAAKGSRELDIRVWTKDGRELLLYKDYYALVVGVGEYDHWTDLRRPVKDAEEVAAVLEKLGMNVDLIKNPTSAQLTKALNCLAYEKGNKKDRAILFFFSGHGQTETLVTGDKLGHIIPSDCPRLEQDRDGFIDKAISMNMIQDYALRIKSKHVLMVFDSCFSGTLFSLQKGIPQHISEKSNRAVRQFITAGNDDEDVPDDGIFKICFIQGIQGEADLDNNGYVTGSELGMYLSSIVIDQSRGSQHPQFGKIRHPMLNKGDFIFVMPSIPKKPVAVTSKTKNSLLAKKIPPVNLRKTAHLLIKAKNRKDDICDTYFDYPSWSADGREHKSLRAQRYMDITRYFPAKQECYINGRNYRMNRDQVIFNDIVKPGDIDIKACFTGVTERDGSPEKAIGDPYCEEFVLKVDNDDKITVEVTFIFTRSDKDINIETYYKSK